MTRQARSLSTPTLEAQAFAVRSTARSAHAFTLAELANDAAGGHVGQRWSLARRSTGVFHGFYESESTAAWLVARAVVSIKGAGSLSDTTTLTLTATDGTSTASTQAHGIPDGLRGDLPIFTPLGTRERSREAVLTPRLWVISLEELRARLGASSLWRLTLDASVGLGHYLESFTLEEAPRLVVDTSEAFGQLPQSYLPRGQVVDGDPSGLQRIGATLEAAFDLSRRTYHAMSADEALPWHTTSGSYAAMSGDAEPGGASIVTVVRGRRMRSGVACRVRFRARYRTTSGGVGSLRLHTGEGTYTLALPSTGGAWADSDVQTAYLKTSGVDRLDSIWWDASTTAGTLSVCARGVWDHPL